MTDTANVQVTAVRKSKSITALAAAMAQAQGKYKGVQKTAYDIDHGRSYADLNDYITATREALAQNGLSVMQPTSADLCAKSVTVTTIVMHKSGQWLEADMVIPATQDLGSEGKVYDQQSIAAAVTWARRIAYASTVSIAAQSETVAQAKAAQEASLSSLRSDEPRINTAQGQNFWRKAQASGKTPEQINGYLRSVGVNVTEELTQAQFPAAMRWADSAEGVTRQ